jgi:hypothetical protein
VAVEGSTERLEAEVCTLAARIAAATCEFVLMVAELDRRRAWATWECRSMAHWLSWKCGLGLVAARTHVRVGRALEGLPVITEEFRAGRLSFSKVRTLTRVATPQTEAQLVVLAKTMTAAQLDQAVRAYERTRVDQERARTQVAARTMRTIHEDDGTVTTIIRETRDSFELRRRAMESALDEVPVDPEADDPAGSRWVDALEVIVRSFLAGNADREPTEMVVHVDEQEMAEPSPVLERLTCDSAVRVGDQRRSQTIPIALRRAIERRDRSCCRFPACTNRRHLHVHHIVFRSRGGPTNEANRVLLCPYHHRAVHEGGWRVHGDARQSRQLIFLHPRGRRMHEYVESPTATRPVITTPDIDQYTIATATGERMDLAHTVDALHQLAPTCS